MFILIFIITLLVLVVIHELGHFLAAKRAGIKVLEFGFGLPPKAWGKQIGETLVSLNWLPIGGFVRLLGEDEVDKKILNNKRSFASQPVLTRIAVVVAGVAMNLTLAWVLFYTVLFIDDFKIIYPTLDPVVSIEEVIKGEAAEKAGLKPGERILKVNNNPVIDFRETAAFIKSKPNQELLITLSDIDGNNQKEVKITPSDLNGEGRIGVAFNIFPKKYYVTPTEKIFSGITYSWDLVRLTFQGLGRIFQDLYTQNFERASQSVAGPVGLAVTTKAVLNFGLPTFIWFVGAISLNLAIFNVLPIPALDGGRLFFLIFEFVFRKKPNAEFEKMVHTVGMVVLLALISLITFSDIRKFF